ncbi:unnamed protein product [Rotaria sordida]|uniref:Uncharacterized protein n=1 Tax=Rotaria sordida TaxID=392033 RepID=A0A818KCL1_9BILA|nr:unnamed protein product [Rotaria sordida]CAF1194931.1 unnamed protein product [Rotaria sordida]CAF3549654.1 unnamed protein product [Rotaria sordida]CAF3764352.1 unnamed protein product [Rotaria sordida]
MIDHLSSSIEQLKLKSKSILSHWQEYNRVLLQIEKIIREPEAGIDRLQTSRQLFSQCDGQTSLKINEITHRIQQQWTNIEQRLQEIIRPSREIVDYWRQFNSSYVHLLDRLDYLNELIEIINQIQIDYKSQQLTDENEINNLKQLHEFHRLLLSKHDLIEHLNSNEFI